MSDPSHKIYKPTTLRSFLQAQGLYAKKGLSQNFLIDGNIIRKILHMASVVKGDFVVEIGPGPGALTQALLETGAHVLAIEMDALFAQQLTRLQTDDQTLQVVCQDVLTFPFLDKLPSAHVKVVANLPYHITTPILTQLLPLYPVIDSLTIMVQKEFADRMSAKPKTAAYSSLTLFLEFYARVTDHFTVSPHCFYPQPKVLSSVVHCQLHPPKLSEQKEQASFFQLTRTAFNQRRKMLRSSLKELFSASQVEQALHTLHLSPTSRPEDLCIEDFLSLYFLLYTARD